MAITVCFPLSKSPFSMWKELAFWELKHTHENSTKSWKLQARLNFQTVNPNIDETGKNGAVNLCANKTGVALLRGGLPASVYHGVHSPLREYQPPPAAEWLAVTAGSPLTNPPHPCYVCAVKFHDAKLGHEAKSLQQVGIKMAPTLPTAWRTGILFNCLGICSKQNRMDAIEKTWAFKVKEHASHLCMCSFPEPLPSQLKLLLPPIEDFLLTSV